MLKRFAPLVPIALSVLLAACASAPAPEADLSQSVTEQASEAAFERELAVIEAESKEQAEASLADFSKADGYRMPALADDILSHGLSLVGTRYRMGGTSVASGFDCSGFVGFLYREEAGLKLPRSTREMININAPKVARNDLKPGDVIFFNNRGRGAVSHAGIYLGDDQFIHSSSSRSGGVRVDSLQDSYWKRSYMQAKRVLALSRSEGNTRQR